jgi:hypothetical protein
VATAQCHYCFPPDLLPTMFILGVAAVDGGHRLQLRVSQPDVFP